MNILDRSVWQYRLPASEPLSLDEYLDSHDLRCAICTDGLSDPVRASPACRPLTGESPGESPLESAVAKPQLAALRVACRCGFDGAADKHRGCILLQCRFDGCRFEGADGTALNLHTANLCASKESAEDHWRECRFPVPLVEWAPSLSFGMSPTDLMKVLWPNDQEDPHLPYTSLWRSPEVTSFECRIYSVPYESFYTLDIINATKMRQFPSPEICDYKSSVMFSFQPDFGLRMVSFKLLVDCRQTELLAKAHSVCFKSTDGVSVAVGRNGKNREEFDIDIFDARVEVLGGLGAYAQAAEKLDPSLWNHFLFLDALEFVQSLFEDISTESLEAIAMLFIEA
ncbi:hypothetical protein BDR26DRAFT_863731 [Obelidium mucronatum]|nr:hypothetical protein BDR26DRAFT_863731 [Obelidium mucronatum]